MSPSYVLGYKKNLENRRKSKSSQKEELQSKRALKTTVKIECLDNWTLLKPTILKYGNRKYYRTSVNKNRTYFFCAARSKGCKVCIVLKDGKPFRMSSFAHNHS